MLIKKRKKNIKLNSSEIKTIEVALCRYKVDTVESLKVISKSDIDELKNMQLGDIYRVLQEEEKEIDTILEKIEKTREGVTNEKQKKMGNAIKRYFN